MCVERCNGARWRARRMLRPPGSCCAFKTCMEPIRHPRPDDLPLEPALPATPADRRAALRPYRARPERHRDRLQSRARELGPGLITGAADDDPSGIATYSQAGAAFGYGTLWIARALLMFGNTVNIAADLGGMAAGASLLTGVPSIWFVPAFTVLILALLILASYDRMTKVLKWMTLALFSYVLAGLLAQPDPAAVLRGTFLPHITWSKAYLLTFVAILGTTISPYLFFWQAAQN